MTAPAAATGWSLLNSRRERPSSTRDFLTELYVSLSGRARTIRVCVHLDAYSMQSSVHADLWHHGWVEIDRVYEITMPNRNLGPNYSEAVEAYQAALRDALLGQASLILRAGA